ncbi:MAG: hypothetical protein U9O97_02830 [Elusimicrobiota bacterium]|nr:hypothetical protein [Elusimicrobiota bacterium]
MLKEFEMELLKKFAEDYRKADKKKRGQILSQYCKLAGCDRWAVIKRFNRYFVRPPKKSEFISNGKRGPKRKYDIFSKKIIEAIRKTVGKICAEKIHPMMGIYIDQLEQNKKLFFYPSEVVKRMRNIPLGTLKKIMMTFPREHGNKHKGNADIYKRVPIIANFGKYANKKPGYTEVDYVEHNGGSSSGTFAITGNYVDIYSQWIARAAGLGKSLSSVESIDKKIHQKVYHQIIHYHPDNAKPILKLLFERMTDKKTKSNFELSRSRPYKKNDNAHVEQKNGDKIRKLVGYFRHDTVKEVDILNQLYSRADLMDNFFIASAKLKKKTKNAKGKVIKRIYDTPKTPYQRLMVNRNVPKRVKTELETIYRSLNMVELSWEIKRLLKMLFDAMNAGEEKTFQGQKIVSNKKAFRGHLISI